MDPDLPPGLQHPSPPGNPAMQVLALATISTLCLLAAAAVLGVACLCTRTARHAAAEESSLPVVSSSRRYAQPPSPALQQRQRQLTLVGHPGGEVVLGAATSPRPRPDKKMCGTHQHTTTIWVEA